MSRMHGEREEIYRERRRFQIEAAVATHAKLLEWEMLRVNGEPLPAKPAPLPCTCSLRSYPHFHSQREQRRFENAMPPGREDFV